MATACSSRCATDSSAPRTAGFAGSTSSSACWSIEAFRHPTCCRSDRVTLRPMTNHGTDSHGASSEVGRLRTVMLHRPGPELKRLTPRNNDKLLFDGIPWVSRAQDEHDAFAQALRDHGVEVLYLADLLAGALETGAAREETIAAVLAD